MDKEFLRNEYYFFNELRKNYLKQKKHLIFEYFNYKDENILNSLKETQTKFHQDFSNFVSKLPDDIKISTNNLDDDLIFWFCFEIDDALNGIHEPTSSGIVTRPEWINQPTK